MREFHDVDLWRVSAFQRIVRSGTQSAYARRHDNTTLLSSSLMSELAVLSEKGLEDDALEALAACLRHSESTLLYFQYEQLVWPITLFPSQQMYHAPRDLAQASIASMGTLLFLRAEPPVVGLSGRDPGRPNVMPIYQYKPLAPLLRVLALNGPRKTLLSALEGKSSFRLNPGADLKGLGLTGALVSAVERMRRQPMALREVAASPGMNEERASRLINALYLRGELIVSNVLTRSQSGLRQRLMAWTRSQFS